MKKARLVITPMDFYFAKIYKCSPEAMFDKLCKTMDSKAAAEKLNNEYIPHVWEYMQKNYKPLWELEKKGFKRMKGTEGTPF